MKRIYILLLGLAIAPAVMAFDGAMPFNPGLMMHNAAGMSNMNNMNMINDQRFRQQEAQDWMDYKSPKKQGVPQIEDETTMQKLFNSRKSRNAEFVEENGEVKIEHLR